jgi:hypothetical protein
VGGGDSGPGARRRPAAAAGQARGRTFSFVIHEPTGSGGFTEIGFSPLLGPQVFVVFGSCTPVPPGRL